MLLPAYLRDLHWLTIPQRAQYKLVVTVHRCLWYLADCCVPVSEVSYTANISIRPAVWSWIFHGFVAAQLAPAGFLSRRSDRRFGTHFLICCVIRPSSLNALCETWKRISLPDIRDRLEASSFHVIALYKLYVFTYLFTYFYNCSNLRIFSDQSQSEV